MNKRYIFFVMMLLLLSLNVFADYNLTGNLKAYYSFENNLNDQLGIYNFSNTGVSYTTGLKGNGVISGSGESNTGINFLNDNAMTLNYWYNVTNSQYFSGTTSSGGGGGFYHIWDGANMIFSTYDDSSQQSLTCAVGAGRHMFTSQLNKTIARLFIDGVQCANVSRNFGSFQNKNLSLFYYQTGLGSSSNLPFDEYGVWSRTLNQTEITQLYNNGSGLNYTDLVSTTLIQTPINFTYTKTCTFSGLSINLNTMSGCY